MHKVLLPVALLLMLQSCRYDKYDDESAVQGSEFTMYPENINRIMMTSCSKSGCHNTISKYAAGGLDLSTWEKMFDGTVSGAVTIPYSTQFSTLLYYTNTDSTEGIVSIPTMPFNEQPLSKADYYALRDWIAAGAPDRNGFVKFSDDPGRKKIYIANQGCDNVAVMDAERKVIMRYVDVGVMPGSIPPESPHMIRVTPDNKYWVVVFIASNVMQVFDASTDELVHNINIGPGGWNTFAISSDSKKAYTVDYSSGKIVFADLETGQVQQSFTLSPYLHGTALNKSDDTLYIGINNNSNILIKIPVNDPLNFETLDLNSPQPAPGFLNPHEIVFSPDFSRYFVSCEGPNANQVRVYSTSDDQLIAAINTGIRPVEMAISESAGLLFVTCMEDNYFPGVVGSVRVIDMNTLQEIKVLRAGWQPHGIAVDEEEGLVYITNRNYQGNPSPPHHPASCNGKNGSLNVIDINSLQVRADIRSELSVDPYGAAVRYRY